MPRWVPIAALIGLVGTLFWLERRRPLRARVDPGARRIARNFALAAATAAAVTAVERPLTRRLSRSVEAHGWGLVPGLRLPRGLATAVTVVLLDYTLYLWHILLHRVPLLWRFHLAHHVDLDLDASTAARFHFLEFLASIPWRLAQIRLIGVTPWRLALWQQLTAVEVVFHHSNLRLPAGAERWMGRIIMTPRLHGIHHSSVKSERDSNFSSGLTAWDAIHGTIRTDVPQEQIIIGVPPYHESRDMTLGKTLPLPFLAGHPEAKGRPQNET